MDLIILLGILSGIITLILFFQGIFSYFYNKTPWVKIILYKIIDKEYKVKIFANKKYPYFKPDIAKIKKRIREKYDDSDFRNTGKNYITVLINELQSTYTIKIMPDIDIDYDEICEENQYEDNSFDFCSVTIDLDGIINFKYKNSDENKEYLDIIENLFDIIEEIEDIKPLYQNYSLKATTNKTFDKSPFKKGNEKKKCKNVNLVIGDSILFLNSEKIYNIYDCLKKYISKII